MVKCTQAIAEITPITPCEVLYSVISHSNAHSETHSDTRLIFLWLVCCEKGKVRPSILSQTK